MSFFTGKRILITGGTGTVGRALTASLLKEDPSVIRIFSRDEMKHYAMEKEFGPNDRLRYLLGDVRDLDRVRMATRDIDVVFHLAGQKHVKYCEYNPFEAVQTNITGTQNVVTAAIEAGVESVVFSSSDKAVNPISTLGATKLTAERLVLSANNYKGQVSTVFRVVRFGNILGSAGSVLPLFIEKAKRGDTLEVYGSGMLRYAMTLKSAVFLLEEAVKARHGDIFFLDMPLIYIKDLAAVVLRRFGRPIEIAYVDHDRSEKLEEDLLTPEECGYVHSSDELCWICCKPSTEGLRLPRILDEDEVESFLSEAGLL